MRRAIHMICILAFCTGTNGNAFGGITLNITVTDIDSSVFDYGTHLIYNGVIGVTPSGGLAPYTYTLTLPSGDSLQQRNGYFPVLDAGTYFLSVTDAGGGMATSKVILAYKYPQPSVTVSNIVIPGCSNTGGFTLTGSGGTPPYSYSIDGGGSFVPGNAFSSLPQGNYVILVKDANAQIGMIGTNQTSKTIPGFVGLFGTLCDVTGSAQFSPSACTGEGAMHATVFSDKASFSLDGVNYHVFHPDPAVPTLYEYDSSGLSPGLYNYYLKGQIGGMSIYAYVIIKYCTIGIAFTGMQASCGGSDGSLTVTASGGNPPYTYTMDGVTYQGANLFTGLASGNYAVTVKDAGGLISSATGTLYDKCPMNITTRVLSPACGDQQGSVTIAVKGGLPPYRYSIDGGNFQGVDSFSNLAQGTHTVTVVDDAGLTQPASVVIGTAPSPDLSAQATAATCTGHDGSITITGKDGTPPYQYSLDGGAWQGGDAFGELSSDSYTASVKDANGCMVSQPVTVPLTKTPVKVSAGHDTSTLVGQPLGLHAIDVDQIGFTRYQWSPSGGLDNPAIADPVATLSSSATYTVRASTPSGCEGTGRVSIKVFTRDDLYVPNAFTPNGDGHNDILRVMTVGIAAFGYFAIYDRLGRRIFYTTNPSDGWDGTVKGVPQQTGVYIWMTGGVDYKGNRVDRRGTVMLLR
jgi:gliding motility-associated-like protein